MQVGKITQLSDKPVIPDEGTLRLRSELKPLLDCPFCGKQPDTYWDHDDETHECYNEGFNIICCNGIHVTAIYKEDAIEKWNTRAI